MSLAMSLFMLVAYTLLGYVVSFKLQFNYFKKIQFFIFNIVMSPYIFLNIYNYLTVDFFFENYFVIVGQLLFMFFAFISFRVIKSKRSNVDFNVLAFQNAGFMALPIIVSLPDSSNLKVLLFLFMVGFNLSIFSIGAMVFSEKGSIKGILNLPFFASVSPIILVFLGLGGHGVELPLLLENVLGLILIPGALFFFGGVIRHSMHGVKLTITKDIVKMIFLKYVAFPVLTFIVVYFAKVDRLVSTLFMLQSL
ncbi:MAG: hypothetical protein WCH76_07340, partial [Candidatus Riflemargulisbacteria bacterium]